MLLISNALPILARHKPPPWPTLRENPGVSESHFNYMVTTSRQANALMCPYDGQVGELNPARKARSPVGGSDTSFGLSGPTWKSRYRTTGKRNRTLCIRQILYRFFSTAI